jgi:hypothetical protein
MIRAPLLDRDGAAAGGRRVGTKIIVFGLPGAGKTTLSRALAPLLDAVHFNADELRQEINRDLGFAPADRVEQARRMGWLCDRVVAAGHDAIGDLVCPTDATRAAFGLAFSVFVDTITEGRFADTNAMFERPAGADYVVREKDAKTHALRIRDAIARRRGGFDWRLPTALFVGRYQPFHEGHRRLVLAGLARVGQACIAVRDVHGIDEKKPVPVRGRARTHRNHDGGPPGADRRRPAAERLARLLRPRRRLRDRAHRLAGRYRAHLGNRAARRHGRPRGSQPSGRGLTGFPRSARHDAGLAAPVRDRAMIVWLASYPRSGNLLTRQILARAFGCLSASEYPEGGDELAAQLGVTFRLPYDGSAEDLIAAARASPDRVFIKTHGPPRDDSPAIHILRDGRAAVVSYRHFLGDSEGLHDLSLAQVIRGEVGFGSWSGHLDAGRRCCGRAHSSCASRRCAASRWTRSRRSSASSPAPPRPRGSIRSSGCSAPCPRSFATATIAPISRSSPGRISACSGRIMARG